MGIILLKESYFSQSPFLVTLHLLFKI
jgi:hypothetical protein